MNNDPTSPPETERASRLRGVIEACMARRGAGDGVSDGDVLAAHADLRPELDRELSLLRLIERARTSSRATVSPIPLKPVAGLPDWLEGYNVIREIHRGGQGVVYEAIQRSTGRRVAVKVRRESFFADRRDTERFNREVEILAQLEHPLIVGVIDSGVYDGRVYFVMDYVDGAAIDEYLAARSLGVREVLRLFEKIVTAVNAAHLRGVIHRDLKPANILVDDAGEPHLLDFGLARLMAEIGEAARAGETMTGQFVGSLPWASPEQAEGQPSKIDLRTDVYSLGVILFQMLTGAMPYNVDQDGSGVGLGLRTAIDVIVTAQPSRPSALRRGVDSDLDTITLKCLSKERERRYQSAGELADDVRRWMESRPIAARPASLRYQFSRFARRNRALVVAGGAVAAALAIGVASTLVQLSRARQAERLAEVRRVEAERQSYVANIGAADSAAKLGDGGTAMLRLNAAPVGLRGWDWRFVRGLADQSQSRFTTGGNVHAAASAGSGLVITANPRGEAVAYDQRTREVVWRKDVPNASYASAADDRVAIVSVNDVVVLDARTGNPLATLGTAPSPSKNIAGVLIAGRPLVAVCLIAGAGVRVVDVNTGSVVWATPKCENCWSAGVDASRDGARLACYDSTDLVVLNTDDWKEAWRRTLRGRETTEHGFVRWSEDGRLLAASINERVEVLDAATGRGLGTLVGHRQPVLAMTFDRTGDRLVTGSIDKSIRLWTRVRGAEGREDRWTSTVLCGHAGTVRGLVVCDDDNTLWSFGDEGECRIWDLSAFTRAPGVLFTAGSNVPSASWFGSDGQLRCSVGKTVMKIDPETSALVEMFENLPLGFIGAIEGTSGRAFGARSATSIGGADLNMREALWVADCPLGLGWMMALSPDAKVLANMDRDHAVRLWDSDTGGLMAIMPGHEAKLRMIRFSADGTRLITSCEDGTARVWDVNARRELLALRPGGAIVMDGAFSPDSQTIVTGDESGLLCVWNASNGQPVWRSQPLGATVSAVLYHPDGTRIATGGRDGLLRIWDAANGDELLQIRGHADAISCLAWSDDGRWLTSTSFEHVVRLWDGGAGSARDHGAQPAK